MKDEETAALEALREEKKNKKAGKTPEIDPSVDPSATPEPTEKKPKKSIFGFLNRKKKADPAPAGGEEDPSKSKDTPTGGEEDPSKPKDKPAGGEEDPSKKTSKPAQNEPAEKKKGKKKLTRAEKKKYAKIPEDEDEQTNPKIRVYNDMARAAYAFSEDEFSREGVSDEDLNRIFKYVKQDYPELFWLKGYAWTSQTVRMNYRCTTPDGKLDVKQIKQKIKELRKAAKEFTKGINAKTNPYQAFLTIYRRLILTLDYDGVGLSAGVDADESKDDVLRSLHSALVEHKVVCAGYAVALQYLLQSVGITCGYVSSERAEGSGHAFNIVKIGKRCYYVDATWGDHSNTKLGDVNKNDVAYDYCCVPYDEFIKTSPKQEPFHTPNKEAYPTLETFQYTTHEFFRYHNAYLSRYDERELVRIFKEAALSYDEKEMGSFSVKFRCESGELLGYIQKILKTGGYFKVLEEAKKALYAENKKAAQLLERELDYMYFIEHSGTAYFYYKTPDKKGKKADKKGK